MGEDRVARFESRGRAKIGSGEEAKSRAGKSLFKSIGAAEEEVEFGVGEVRRRGAAARGESAAQDVAEERRPGVKGNEA